MNDAKQRITGDYYRIGTVSTGSRMIIREGPWYYFYIDDKAKGYFTSKDEAFKAVQGEDYHKLFLLDGLLKQQADRLRLTYRSSE